MAFEVSVVFFGGATFMVIFWSLSYDRSLCGSMESGEVLCLPGSKVFWSGLKAA